MPFYDYSLSGHFSNGVSRGLLHTEVAESSLSSAGFVQVYSGDLSGDEIQLEFTNSLSPAEELILDGLIAAHDPAAPPSASSPGEDQANIKHVVLDRAPTSTDDTTEGFDLTSRWFDSSAGELYLCKDPSQGAAVWEKLTVDAELTALITSNTSSINSNAAGIINNASSINSNATGITGNNSSIGINATNIAANTTVANAANAAASANATAISGLQSNKVNKADTPAGGYITNTYAEPRVSAIRSGTTKLDIGAIPDGQYLKRDGANIVGTPPPSAGLQFIGQIEDDSLTQSQISSSDFAYRTKLNWDTPVALEDGAQYLLKSYFELRCNNTSRRVEGVVLFEDSDVFVQPKFEVEDGEEYKPCGGWKIFTNSGNGVKNFKLQYRRVQSGSTIFMYVRLARLALFKLV